MVLRVESYIKRYPSPELPVRLRDLLNQLAGTAEVEFARARISEHLLSLAEGPNSSPPESIPELSIDWTEGTEKYAKIDIDQIFAQIGFKDKVIPGFESHLDPDGLYTRYDPQWKALEESNTLLPLEPRWHQAVAILKMLHLAFEGKPIMLLDEVGIGKTMQILGFIACLAAFHNHHEQFGFFPGVFRKSSMLRCRQYR